MRNHEVRDTNCFGFAFGMKLLHLFPELIPVFPWPMNKIKVHIVGLKFLERILKTLISALEPVRQLCGDKDLLSGDTRVFDGLADILLVVIV